ncbi:MAG: hypothetical protein HQL89_15930 [Magnetococcales bacterium]|nr:hypothetical protein [Magnetococcales bacterium]
MLTLETKSKAQAWKPFCLNSKTRSKPWGQSPRPLFSFDDFFHIMLISSAIAMGLNFFVLDFNGKIEGN